jgi:Fibronectin type III domain
MTISTSSSTPDLRHRSLASIWLLLPGLMFGAMVLGSARKPSHRRKIVMIFPALVLLPLAFVLLSCAGVSGGGSGGGNCAAAPTVPSNLTASNITGTSTTLNWSVSSATVGCAVAYTLYEGINGASPTPLANTTTNTNYVISGLTAQTQYTFAVAAADSFGTSAQSTSITVTTTGAAYTITVTGTSPGTPSDPGQSTQVTLVVN